MGEAQKHKVFNLVKKVSSELVKSQPEHLFGVTILNLNSLYMENCMSLRWKVSA